MCPLTNLRVNDMKKPLLLLALASLSSLPVQAQDAPSQPAWRKVISMPLGVAGVMCGMAIGVPVKTVKAIKSETKRMYDTIGDDVGNTGGIADRAISASLGVPYGVASGTILGCVHGVQDGVKYGYSKPFSKESMSIVEADAPKPLP